MFPKKSKQTQATACRSSLWAQIQTYWNRQRWVGETPMFKKYSFIGLSAMLLNINIQYTFEYKIESKWKLCIFSAKYVQWSWLGLLTLAEHFTKDTWIVWILIEYLGDNFYKEDPIVLRTSSSNTHIIKRQMNYSLRFCIQLSRKRLMWALYRFQITWLLTCLSAQAQIPKI